MKCLFQFTDVPKLGQVWETELDVDVAIHTRPALVAARDRFARSYGTNYARQELRMAVLHGLKDFGYELIPRLDRMLEEHLYELRSEARESAILANGAIEQRWVEEDVYRAVERRLLVTTLDNPASTQRFVRDVVTELAELDPVDRMRRIYALRGAYLGERLPFAEDTPEMLAEAFGSAQAIPRLEHPDDLLGPKAQANYERIVELGSNPRALLLALASQEKPFDDEPIDVEALRSAAIADIMAGLTKRLAEDDEFLDTLISIWILPRVEENYQQMDDRIDELLGHLAPDTDFTRDKLLAMDHEPEWADLAAKVGTPLPDDIPGRTPDA